MPLSVLRVLIALTIGFASGIIVGAIGVVPV